jgi:hypothetical protein
MKLCSYDIVIGCPGNTALNDVAQFFLNGETMPFTHEHPLANCSSREEDPGTIRLMGALSRKDPVVFRSPSLHRAPLPGVPVASITRYDFSCIRPRSTLCAILTVTQVYLHHLTFLNLFSS